MGTEEIYLKALKEIQDICYPILDSGRYETSHSKIAKIASNAIHSANDEKLNDIKSIIAKNDKILEADKSKSK